MLTKSIYLLRETVSKELKISPFNTNFGLLADRLVHAKLWTLDEASNLQFETFHFLCFIVSAQLFRSEHENPTIITKYIRNPVMLFKDQFMNKPWVTFP